MGKSQTCSFDNNSRRHCLLAAAKKEAGPTDQISSLCSKSFLALVPFLLKKVSKSIFCALEDLRSSSCAKSPRQPTSGLLEVEAVGEKKEKKKPWKVENDRWWRGTPAPA